jgi:hypothetical protein
MKSLVPIDFQLVNVLACLSLIMVEVAKFFSRFFLTGLQHDSKTCVLFTDTNQKHIKPRK